MVLGRFPGVQVQKFEHNSELDFNKVKSCTQRAVALVGLLYWNTL